MNTKFKILELLEQNRGERISGERMAGELKISRNAVWKAINELRKSGHRISAVPNKGYSLEFDNDILSVQGMLPFLKNAGISDKITVYDTLENTNKTAKELAVAGAEHITVVVANSQAAGRGRYSRSFYSPAGDGIYLSIVLHPAQLPFAAPTLITAFAAVAVCRAVESATGRTPTIKWVNDIFIDGKKLCGILTEAVTDFESGAIQWVVVGIGINFSVKTADFPNELRDIATSLYPDCNADITRNRLIAGIINEITADGEAPAELLAEYKRRLMMLGKKITVKAADESYEAVAVDIDNSGRLLVETASGEVRALSSGEIGILV